MRDSLVLDTDVMSYLFKNLDREAGGRGEVRPLGWLNQVRILTTGLKTHRHDKPTILVNYADFAHTDQ